MSKVIGIKKLGKSEEFVYDPVCEAPHAYIANGMVNHNCVLWIDEIEKGLSGTKSSNFSDGGTLSRVFGTLLTAMEEGLEGVTIVATANDITALPPELIRRFNEVFFVDLPIQSERKDIFNIHLKKRGRDPEKLNLDIEKLAHAAEKYTGAEIEKVIKDSIAKCFNEGRCALTDTILLDSIKSTRPIASVMVDQIKTIRDWGKDRARFASSLALEEITKGKTVKTKSGKTLVPPGMVDVD